MGVGKTGVIGHNMPSVNEGNHTQALFPLGIKIEELSKIQTIE